MGINGLLESTGQEFCLTRLVVEEVSQPPGQRVSSIIRVKVGDATPVFPLQSVHPGASTEFFSRELCAGQTLFYHAGMPSETDLRSGQLLLAHPSLLDPNFRRSIIHLVDHDDQKGSFGFVLNRPTGQTLGEIAGEPLSPALAEIPVYIGGPVSAQRVIIARLHWEAAEQEFTFDSNPDLESEDEEAPGELHAFIGYTGWGNSQLSGELREGAWLPHTPDPKAVRADTSTWKKLLGALGVRYRLLAEKPDDPSLN